MRSGKPLRAYYLVSTAAVGRERPGVWHPNTDIYETEEAVVVAIEIPGVGLEDLQVVQDEDRLLVRGLRRPGICQKPKRFHQIEIICGEFEKEIVLPQSLRGAPVEAALALGVLSLTITKASSAAAEVQRRIEIEAK